MPRRAVFPPRGPNGAVRTVSSRATVSLSAAGPLDTHNPQQCGATFGFGHLPFNLTLTQSHTHTHSLSLVLVVMMKSKELKTKISHAHSLILSQSQQAPLILYVFILY